jgi:hypothetical protein
MDARPGRQEAEGAGGTPPTCPSLQPTELRRMKRILNPPQALPPSCWLPSFLTSDSCNSAQPGQILLSRLRRWVARNRREQHLRVSSICSFFEFQITSKCCNPESAKRSCCLQQLHIQDLMNLWDPFGSHCQWPGPRGCHCLRELGNRRERRVFTPSQPRRTLQGERVLPV